jgi:hypothetical protein
MVIERVVPLAAKRRSALSALVWLGRVRFWDPAQVWRDGEHRCVRLPLPGGGEARVRSDPHLRVSSSAEEISARLRLAVALRVRHPASCLPGGAVAHMKAGRVNRKQRLSSSEAVISLGSALAVARWRRSKQRFRRASVLRKDDGSIRARHSERTWAVA